MHRWQGKKETENEKLLGKKTKEQVFAESIEIYEKKYEEVELVGLFWTKCQRLFEEHFKYDCYCDWLDREAHCLLIIKDHVSYSISRMPLSECGSVPYT